MPVRELFDILLRTLPLYVQRIDLLMIVGMVLFLIYTQYQRVAFLEKRLFGFVKNPPGEQMARALLYGLGGGILATGVFVVLGISLNEAGIWYLWLLAILLMFFHPRFLCFSYGGGLLALSYLLFGFPRLDVAAVMSLVAVLHLVEAVLIYVSGATGASPVYVRRPSGRVVGGFALQRFWPLPFIALVGALVPPEFIQAGQGVDMPDWWPVIRPSLGERPGLELAFSLFPVVAALGYSDVALTSSPVEKARKTARNLLFYSLGLLGLAILSQAHLVFAFAAALFSPLAHEWVIRAGRAAEAKGEPKFAGPETMVLDTAPGSPAARAGIVPGDVILAVNGIPVDSRRSLAEAIDPWVIDAELEVENAFDGERRRVLIEGKIPPLGVVLVPDGRSGLVMELNGEPRWRRAIRSWGSRLLGRMAGRS